MCRFVRHEVHLVRGTSIDLVGLCTKNPPPSFDLDLSFFSGDRSGMHGGVQDTAGKVLGVIQELVLEPSSSSVLLLRTLASSEDYSPH